MLVRIDLANPKCCDGCPLIFEYEDDLKCGLTHEILDVKYNEDLDMPMIVRPKECVDKNC